eukprot:scaffold103758_cov23-Tisochrysis_lutea.AAC.2
MEEAMDVNTRRTHSDSLQPLADLLSPVKKSIANTGGRGGCAHATFSHAQSKKRSQRASYKDRKMKGD